MVGPEDIIVNESLFNPAPVDDVTGDKKIIDPPPDVAVAGLETIGPPRIFYSVGVKMAEGVNVSVFNDPVEPVTFNAQKPGGFFVRFRILQVDFIVGGVIISSNNQASALVL